MSWRGRELRLATRPRGEPTVDDFALAEATVHEPEEGRLVVRNAYFSLDPYMRLPMTDIRSDFRAPCPLGQALPGGAVGRVLASRHPAFGDGDWVVHNAGWREIALVEGAGVTRLDPAPTPVSTALGVLGMPGFTAWYGSTYVGRPEAGETVYVSSAAGAVGSVAGQIARIRGARVIGSAGSEGKVAWLRELGFDGAFNYRDTPAGEALRALAPDGIDLYWDNVGGEQLEAAIGALRPNGRVVACGGVALYNEPGLTPGPRNLHLLFTRELTVRGFRYSTHLEHYAAFEAEVGAWVREGRVRYRETVVDGIENAPAAFVGLFRGDDIGKLVVRLSEP